jgi:hypothetical protein
MPDEELTLVEVVHNKNGTVDFLMKDTKGRRWLFTNVQVAAVHHRLDPQVVVEETLVPIMEV